MTPGDLAWIPGDLVGVLVNEIDFLAEESVVAGAKVFFLSTEGEAVFLWLIVVVVVVDLTVNLLDAVEVVPTAGLVARSVEGFAGQVAGLPFFSPESMRDDVGAAVLVADGLCWIENMVLDLLFLKTFLISLKSS